MWLHLMYLCGWQPKIVAGKSTLPQRTPHALRGGVLIEAKTFVRKKDLIARFRRQASSSLGPRKSGHEDGSHSALHRLANGDSMLCTAIPPRMRSAICTISRHLLTPRRKGLLSDGTCAFSEISSVLF